MTIYYEDWEELEKNHNLFMMLGFFFFVRAKRVAENLFFNKIFSETTGYSFKQKPKERLQYIEARCNEILLGFKEAMGVELNVAKHSFRYSVALKTPVIFDEELNEWTYPQDEYIHEVLLYLTMRKIFDYVSQYKTLTADEKLDMFREVVSLI